MIPTRDDVVAAAQRLDGHIVRTPAIRARAVDEAAGAAVYLKAESLQHIGAFKARGALHTVGRLDEAARARGVITYSSGNHAQAVALAAARHGVPADIAMPTDAPAIKVEVVRALGANIVFAGTTSEHRKAAAHEIRARTGGAIVEPFDHPDIVCGQGTATLELLAQAGEPLDALVVPVGGGGLLAGACLAVADTKTAIYTAEPVGCDAMAQSLAAGERVAVEPGPTIADGLKPTRVGELNFAIASARVADSFTVTDAEIRAAMRLLVLGAKLVVEPSGAAALAAALRGLPGAPRRIGVLVSGGNVDPTLLAEVVGNTDS